MLRHYGKITMSYGAFHAGIRAADMDSLPGKKIASIIISAVSAPALFPIYVYNDINRLYISYNNIDGNLYNYKDRAEDVFDVIFE